MKWIVQIEWLKKDVVDIRFIQHEGGYEDKAVALDHFAEGWIEERKEAKAKEEKE